MSPATGLSALLSELKRRRVIRVTVVYALVAWAVIEVVETTFPYLGLPEWTITAVIVLAALGLPVTVVLAWAFDLTSAGVERAEPLQQIPRRTVWAGLGILVLAAAGVLAGTLIRSVPSSLEANLLDANLLDANLIVVLPFRVGGAEPTEQYLREGMLDLLSAKLSGTGGPRAVDPRSVLSRWSAAVASPQDDLDRASALQLAGDLGAGRLLLGEVVSARPHLLMTASILDVASGRVRGRASVEGMPDSVPALVDRLAGALLSLEAGEDAHRVDALTSTSLPALRAYLEGQASRRQGRYPEARAHFELALQLDSTFALAALRLDRTASWIGGLGEVRARAIRLAWAFQDRLSPRDRAHLIASAGPRYPALSPVAEQVAAWERAIDAAPDRSELWEEYADLLFHFGRALGLDDAEQRAEAAFLRAMELDPGIREGLHHLVILAARSGDRSRTLRYGERYLQEDSAGDAAEFIRWRVAVATQDTAGLARIRAEWDTLSSLALLWILISAQEEGLEMDDGQRALELLTHRAANRSERWNASVARNQVAMNRGRVADGLQATIAMRESQPSPHEYLWQQIQNALYWDGDSATAAAAVRQLNASADAELREDPEGRAYQFRDICFVEQWRLRHGQVERTRDSLVKLRDADLLRDSPLGLAEAQLCGVLLATLLAHAEGRADAGAWIDRLDEHMQTFPPGIHNWYANLLLADLHEARGDFGRALAAVRRRPFRGRLTPSFASSYLWTEARLAQLTGDAEGAVRAYNHYLILRSDPDPELVSRSENARAELDALR